MKRFIAWLAWKTLGALNGAIVIPKGYPELTIKNKAHIKLFKRAYDQCREDMREKIKRHYLLASGLDRYVMRYEKKSYLAGGCSLPLEYVVTKIKKRTANDILAGGRIKAHQLKLLW